MSLRTLLLFAVLGALLSGLTRFAFAQAQTKNPPVGPPVPQSTHYPIFLIAHGNEPTWELRLGIKGPERLDRPGYPPIPLEPGGVTREGTADAWTYRAKDSQTGADVALHLKREACGDTTPDVKYTFSVVLGHAQIGFLNGCARIAADQFVDEWKKPDKSDDDEPDQPKLPAPTVTKFTPPVAVAYLNSAGNIVLKRGKVTRVVAPQGQQLALSHDGKRLLYTRQDTSTDRTIVLYDDSTGKSTDLVRGDVQETFWSPDDTRVAFLKFVDSKWRVWTMPVAPPEQAAELYSGEVLALHGWADAHTILADNYALYWIGDDGTLKQTLSSSDLYGGLYGPSSANTARIHPLNPDLLLVSAEILKPPLGAPTDPHMGTVGAVFLYEVRSKRRVLLSPPNLYCLNAEWSRDGLQVFFTSRDSPRATSIYRIFWDGSGLKKSFSGSNLVIGQ